MKIQIKFILPGKDISISWPNQPNTWKTIWRRADLISRVSCWGVPFQRLIKFLEGQTVRMFLMFCFRSSALENDYICQSHTFKTCPGLSRSMTQAYNSIWVCTRLCWRRNLNKHKPKGVGYKNLSMMLLKKFKKITGGTCWRKERRLPWKFKGGGGNKCRFWGKESRKLKNSSPFSTDWLFTDSWKEDSSLAKKRKRSNARWLIKGKYSSASQFSIISVFTFSQWLAGSLPFLPNSAI